MSGGKLIDYAANISRAKKASRPTRFARFLIAVDPSAKLDGEARLARAGAADKRLNRNVGVTVEPDAKLSQLFFSTDQIESQ
jgi:hypothetical protein